MSGPHAEGNYKRILDSLSDGVYETDRDRRIRYWNQGASTLTGYVAADVIGRQCGPDLLDHVDAAGQSLCDTRCPLTATLTDGAPREVQVWLRQKDGHRRPVRVRTASIRDARGAITGAVETFADDSAFVETQRAVDDARRDATVDSLTGLPNRRAFDVILERRLEVYRRHGWPFGLVMADIDDFKKINDSRGHSVGDRALRTVAETLTGGLRAGDQVFRWGGDEFVILVEAGDSRALLETAERLQARVTQSLVETPRGAFRVTVSVGGAAVEENDTATARFDRADAALLGVKHDRRRHSRSN